jgi:hypothetical protein
MVVSALVVSLPVDPTSRADLLAHLTRDPRLVLGEPVDGRLPVVAETEHARAGADLVEELCELAGVRVDVVTLDFGGEP